MTVIVGCVTAQTRPERKDPQAQPAVVPNEPPVAPCPKIEMRSTQKPVRDGEPGVFSVTLTGGDPKAVPVFIWSISAGTFLRGQGTRNIAIDTTGAGVNKGITATVQVSGLAPECSADAAATLSVAGPAKKLDEYGVLAEADEKARLDALMAAVTDKEQAFIFVYAGRTSPRGQAYANLKRIRAYLTKAGAPRERVVTIDGGFREQVSYELWLVPVGAEAPKSTPTINAKDIVYPKTTPSVRKP